MLWCWALPAKPTIEVIKSVNQSRKGLQMYALSVLATAGNLKALGNDGSGVAISQVVPFPSNAVMPLVRDYQQAMKAAGVNEFSHLSLEGYLNARVVAEGHAARRAQPDPRIARSTPSSRSIEWIWAAWRSVSVRARRAPPNLWS
jgi:branched-chain amino acid transport system substrate-binding protein